MGLNKNIRIVGSTAGLGIVLAINSKDLDKEGAKCASIQNKEVSVFEDIGTPMTFNAFRQVEEKESDLIKAILNRKLTDEGIEQINVFLSHEDK